MIAYERMLRMPLDRLLDIAEINDVSRSWVDAQQANVERARQA